MAKQITKKIKLQIQAGKATPAPPVGTILGPVGINLGEFCTKFNDATKDKMGDVLPVVISIYDDRSFDFELKTPPAAFLLKKAAKLKKGSSQGAKDTAGSVTRAQIREIAETKMVDLNAYDIEAAMNIIQGTAHNMGIIVSGEEEVQVAPEIVEEIEEVEKIASEEGTEANEEITKEVKEEK